MKLQWLTLIANERHTTSLQLLSSTFISLIVTAHLLFQVLLSSTMFTITIFLSTIITLNHLNFVLRELSLRIVSNFLSAFPNAAIATTIFIDYDCNPYLFDESSNLLFQVSPKPHQCAPQLNPKSCQCANFSKPQLVRIL